MSLLSELVPTIATALGSPIAGAAVEFLAGKLGVSDATTETIKNTIQGLDPNKAKELDVQLQEFLATNGIQLQVAQIGVNNEEAKSTSIFIAGWRPFVGWIGGIGLGYAAIVEPLARFIATVGFHYSGPFPVIDTTLTMQVLSGLIGFGIMRTYEKKTGTEGNR